MIRSYKDLEVWQQSMNLVVECYELTGKFPKKEVYGLSSQLQRAAVSIPANIAEGRQRQHKKEFMQHLSIAYGSLAELETHMLIAGRLHYVDKMKLDEIINKTGIIGKMINGLRKSLQNS
jgi:four helix bundle protein